jgi:putative sporulation protein YyaC
MSFSQQNNNSYSVNYTDRFATFKLSRHLRSLVPLHDHSYIVCCIGTDRSTGDSLGPLTGSLLEKYRLDKLQVYGTLHKPLHALNLSETIKSIHESFNNPFIIAVDAALGHFTSIGKFYCGTGPLQPGSALNKDLPEIGHVHVSATVNLNSHMNYMILQNTRLSVVYDMAMILATCLYRLDLYLSEPSKHYFIQ